MQWKLLIFDFWLTKRRIIQSNSKENKTQKPQPLGDVKGNRVVYVSKNCSELALGRKKNSRMLLLLKLHHKDYENLQFFCCCFLDRE